MHCPRTPIITILTVAFGLNACGSEVELYRDEQFAVRSLCSPSNFALLNGFDIVCEMATVLPSQVLGEKPCRADLDVGSDGSIESTTAYDEFGYPTSGTSQYVIREDGQIEQVTFELEQTYTLSFAYHEDGRVRQARAGDVAVDYVWEDGRILEEVSGDRRRAYLYDDEGRVSVMRDFLSNEPGWDYLSFSYQRDGRRSSLVHRPGPGAVFTYRYRYSGDDITITPEGDPNGRWKRYRFQKGRLQSAEFDGPPVDGAIDSTRSYSYCD